MSTDVSPQRLGKYELRERLGHNGMTEVWKAFDTQLQRLVVITILHADPQTDPDFMTRFESESRIIASLYQPNIVQIHDFQISQSPVGAEVESSGVGGLVSARPFAYIVMEYIEGQTLADYIGSASRVRNFPPAADIAYLFTSIGSAVDYAHQSGIKHLGIRPENILLNKRAEKTSSNVQRSIGEPILTNFGITRLMNTSASILSDMWFEALLYMSPEEAMGNAGTELSDIYSLGVILYEICTGKLPFQGDNAYAILKQQINTPPPLPSSINSIVPPALEEVILCSLAKDPAERFPNAASMAVAISNALNIQITGSLSRSYTMEASPWETTPFDPTSPVLSPLMTPTAPPLSSQALVTPTGPFAAPVGTQFIASPGSSPTSTPSGSTQVTPVLHLAQDTPRMASLLTPTTLPYPQVRAPGAAEEQSFPTAPLPRKKRRGLFIALIVLLLLVLVNIGVGVFTFVSQRASANTIVGQAFFVSSGQLSDSNSQGINDEFQIKLYNIGAPAPGKSYYAWLLNDQLKSQLTCITKNEPTIVQIPLGKLPPVVNGMVQYLYRGDAKHTNLISCTSRLLITESASNSVPRHPSSDTSTWRYYAQLPQVPDPTNTNRFSGLDDLRQLLYEGGDLKNKGIHGGQDLQLLRNTEKIWEWASSARDSWRKTSDVDFFRRQAIRILDYLDGRYYITRDVPHGTPLLADPTKSIIALLQISKKGSDSYMKRITDALNRLSTAPQVSQTVSENAKQIVGELANVGQWLMQVRLDALHVIKMSDQQLVQDASAAILDDMQTQAGNAFIGEIDPSSGKVQNGSVQIYNEIQNLATFSITPYQSA